MRYKTVIELITDGDCPNEAIDKAGEYLRGTYHTDVPLRIRTQPMTSRNVIALGYTIAICVLALSFSFVWFSAGRTYQKLVSNKQKIVETYAVNPPLSTDIKQDRGKDFKKSWDDLYKQKVLYGDDKNIDSK